MRDLFAELEAEEKGFLNSEFLSPVVKGQKIRVRIAGIVMSMLIDNPKDFQGWGVFKPTNYKSAYFLREPSMKERSEYLNLFPAFRFVLCGRDEDSWYGIQANGSDKRFVFKGLVPVRLVDEGQMFETVIARFDGQNVWFEERDSKHPFKNAVVLRDNLTKLNEPDKVELTGWTKEEKEAYNYALISELEKQKETDEDRIKKALKRAGAEYRGYIERHNTFTVEMSVDGQTYRPVIDKKTLSVQSAGICLVDHRTGIAHDSDFDLQSLVSVYREGQNDRAIYRLGR